MIENSQAFKAKKGLDVTGTSIFRGNATFSNTDFISLPVGPASNRPGTPTSGMIRHNSDTDHGEYYSNSMWRNIELSYKWTTVSASTFSVGTVNSSAGYACDTTSNTINFTLPTSPMVGDRIAITDAKGTFSTNAVTVVAGTNKINGSSSNQTLNVSRQFVEYTWTGDTNVGWAATGMDFCNWLATASVGGSIVTVPVTATAMTLTQAQYTKSIITLTGTLTGNTTIIVPTSGQWIFENQTTMGTYSLTIQTPSGTGQQLLPNKNMMLFADGTNVNLVGSNSSSGTATVAVSSTSVTLNSNQYANSIIILTGTLTGNTNIIVPNSGQWIFENQTTMGSYTLTVKTAAGTGTQLVANKSILVFSDGTNVNAAGVALTSTYTPYEFTASSGQTVFNGMVYTPGLVQVYINGRLLSPVDYTATDGQTVSFSTSPFSGGETVRILSWLSQSVSTTQLRQISEQTAASNGQTTFNVAYTPGLIDVYQNGRKLLTSDFTATDGLTVVMNTPSLVTKGDSFRFEMFQSALISNPVLAGVNFNTNVSYSTSTNLTASTLGGVVTYTGSSAATFTLVPSLNNTAGAVQTIVNNGSGVLSIVPNGTDVFSNRASTGSSFSLIYLYPGDSIMLTTVASTNTWIIVGGSIADMFSGSGTPAINRNTVISGPYTSTGSPSAVGTGTGLQPQLNAPLNITFANGFNAYGQNDLYSTVTTNQSWPAVPASNLSYLYANHNSPYSVGLGSTLAAPQIGQVYNQASQSLLHFEGSVGSTTFIDDFGNTWTAVGGAKLQSNWKKFGSTALGGSGTNNALNGTSDGVIFGLTGNSPTINLSKGWSARCWVNPSSLPASGVIAAILAMGNVSGTYGAMILGIYNNGGSIKFALWASSNGSTEDISNIGLGVTTPVVGTAYYVEATYDSVSGYYKVYVNGIQEVNISSSLTINTPANFTAGFLRQNGTNTLWFNGYIDEVEFLPYCDHPAGTAYTVPSAAKSISTPGYSPDFYSTMDGKMYQISGPSTTAGVNPTMTAVQRVYLGTAKSGASTISSVYTNGYNGQAGTSDIDFGIPVVGSKYGMRWTSSLAGTTRFTGTTYYNTSGREIWVSFFGTYVDTYGYVNGSMVARSYNTAGNTNNYITFPVPNGASYSITGTNFYWFEYR